MTEPDTVQAIVLPDGRRLAFAEYGDLSGRAVFHFHGSAGSRLDRPADEGILWKQGIRFISISRPGHGQSDFQHNRRLVDWPKDVSQLASSHVSGALVLSISGSLIFVSRPNSSAACNTEK